MISTNSMAAFTQEVARTRPAAAPQEAQGVGRARSTSSPIEPVAQRKLEAVPPAPAQPVPRGSLLDLRV